ncbi:hypothetical protein GPECTOR_35g914 [Gonium pectorale]|uniref:Rhodanese domain-containing protein n=1 Tax=Gonium pectorale TaxID=33097 RepID=A0A150GC99_GONPE|nr:hypothetical protein GPECTOR_35g914 [Gonium pectorale]|eukprot:KXZ47476.1 hypothetical protein GPECTOR_35g914 [Gonium pectorale]
MLERTVLVDIRHKALVKEEGLVDLKEAKKKTVSVVYAEPDDEEGSLVVDPEFASKLQAAAGVSEESIVILLDSDGSLAPKAAADAAQGDFFREKVYWIRDGMEGPKGWKASELPTKPYRVFELPSVALPTLELPSLELPAVELPEVDLSALAEDLQAQVQAVQAQVPTEVAEGITATADKVGEAVTTITERYRENPTVANGILAAAGVVAVGAFALTELEAILQVLGALGLARFVATNLLFAKDREATLANLRAFLKERGLDQLSLPSGSGSSSSPQGDLQRLASIVMGARDADAAAQQITSQMVPDVKGANPEALAAALAAAGIDPSAPLPALAPVPAPTHGSVEQSAPEAVPVVAAAEATVAPAPQEAAPEVATVVAEAPAVPAVEETAEAEVVMAPVVASSAPDASAAPVTPATEAEPAEAPEAEVVPALAEVTSVAPTEVVAEAEAEPAAEVAEVAVIPANVQQARAWISAWKDARAAAVAAPASEQPEDTTAPAAAAEVTPVAATAAAEVAEAPAEASEAKEQEAEVSAVPADVVAVREWIAAWKDSRQAAAGVAAPAAEAAVVPAPAESVAVVVEAVAPSQEAATEAPVPPNVQEAREWIAAWKAEAANEPAFIGGDGASDSDPAEAPEAVAAEAKEEAVVVNVAA